MNIQSSMYVFKQQLGLLTCADRYGIRSEKLKGNGCEPVTTRTEEIVQRFKHDKLKSLKG